jgi:ParB family chromosome partitioning protein
MKKKALGKGLKAFLPDDYGILKEERYTELEIDRLVPNPYQPRMTFKEEAIDELARSIKETGILQPLVVVPGENDLFYIVVGERRWRAAQKIGLQHLPVIIRKLSKAQQLEASLVENLQREDLNPLEVALAYQKMIEELGYTQQEVAEKVGKERASVANYLRLLKLPPEIKAFLMEGRLSMGHARALLALEEADLQISLARKIIKHNLSVREVEKIIQKINAPPPSKKETHPTPDPDLLAAQEQLIHSLGTKVTISGTLEKGVIKIYYYSADDLNRLFDKIKGAK